MDDPTYIYKILTAQEWQKTQKANKLMGNDWDKKDGFIHISTAKQAERIAKKYHSTMTDGYLLKIEYAKVKDMIKWEPNSKNELFPHAYGIIDEKKFTAVIPLDMKTFNFSTLEN